VTSQAARRPTEVATADIIRILLLRAPYEHLWFWRVEVSASISVDDVVNRLIKRIGDRVGFFPVHGHMSDFD
jgi:hypothetical protein